MYVYTTFTHDSTCITVVYIRLNHGLLWANLANPGHHSAAAQLMRHRFRWVDMDYNTHPWFKEEASGLECLRGWQGRFIKDVWNTVIRSCMGDPLSCNKWNGLMEQVASMIWPPWLWPILLLLFFAGHWREHFLQTKFAKPSLDWWLEDMIIICMFQEQSNRMVTHVGHVWSLRVILVPNFDIWTG